jgi:23S rRNA (cytosine1962-C5)-methyltransferase
VMPFDGELIRDRVKKAADLRTALLPGRECYRVVFGESDGLPGLVVDRYGPVIVFQIGTLAMELLRGAVIATLKDLFAPVALVERSDLPNRENEGLAGREELVEGTIPENFTVTIGGLRYNVDPLKGQKTGLYLDQVDNWAALRPFAKGAHVLDLFCHVGGFGLNASAAGAASVRCVDASEAALTQVKNHTFLNGLSRIETRQADAFDYIRAKPGDFDLIICDPPPFARSRKQLEGALRGYRELNRQCFKMLRSGGIMLSASCSAAVSGEDFDHMLQLSAADAGRTARILPGGGQPADHPPLLGMPETHYLKTRIVMAD